MKINKPVIKKIKFTKAEQEEIDLMKRGQMKPNIKTTIDKHGNTHEMVYQRRFAYSTSRSRLV